MNPMLTPTISSSLAIKCDLPHRLSLTQISSAAGACFVNLRKSKSMEIEHSAEGFCGKFAAIENGVQLGMLTYTQMDEGRISINYTEVNPVHEGKGIGHHLVEAAVQFARKEGYKILPLCWFVKLVLHKHPEYKDVLG